MKDRIDLIETITTPLTPTKSEETITEGIGPQKFYYLEGLFLEGEVENNNGRTYPMQEIKNAVNSLNERIQKTGPIPGELDHPEGMNINFDRLAVAILNIRLEGSNGYGKMRVVPGGLGKIVESAIEAGINVGVSSRGTGNVDDRFVVSDYEIATVDAVLNPSAPNAYPIASLSEKRDMFGRRGHEIFKLAECSEYDSVAGAYLGEELKKFIVDLGDNNRSWRN